MKFFYTKGWFRARKKHLGLLTESKAKALHDKKEIYTVLIDNPDRPTSFIEINLKLGFVGVFFLDLFKNVILEYIFSSTFLPNTPIGKLFLSRIVVRMYLPLHNTMRESESTYFGVDGIVRIDKVNHETNEITTTKSEEPMDYAANGSLWEDIPEFGKYESLARRER